MTDAAQDWSSVATAWDAEVAEVDHHAAAATDAMVAHLALEPGQRVLELACGPGTLGPTWSELVGPDGTVVLSDIAPGMVEVAARRNATLGNVSVVLLDACAIDRPDASFDAVASRMGLMFAPDPSVALGEIRRVLAPGGRFGALTWGAIEHNPWMTTVGMAAMASGIVSGGPPVGPGTIFSLSDPGTVESLAQEAGFTDVKVETFEVRFRDESIAAHVERVTSMAGPIAAAIQAATPEQRAAMVRTAGELAAAYVTEDGIDLPGRAVLVTGNR